MCSLPVTHPEAYTSISNGEFGLQRGSKPFSQVPRDQAIEQTLNKTTKTHGGIIGFSRNIQDVHRWTITADERASLREKCFSMAGLKPHHTEEHQESSSTRLNKDEEDVRNVVGFVESLGNPFTSTSDLHSIASGLVASAEVYSDLMAAGTKGKHAFE